MIEHNADNVGDFSHDQIDMIVHMPFLEECAARSGTIIEIGVGHGNGSTRAFARGLARSTHKDKMHIGVDWDPVRPQIAPTENWHMIHGASENRDTMGRVWLLLDQRQPDIIFIDTIHTYEQMQMELPVWDEIAGSDTLWIFHDTNMHQIYNHMTEAIKEYANVNHWEFFEYALESHGLGVMHEKGSRWSWITPRELRASASY